MAGLLAAVDTGLADFCKAYFDGINDFDDGRYKEWKPWTRTSISIARVCDLVPYCGNAKGHPDWQVEQIAESIKQFGNCDPIAIWHDEEGKPVVVEGHGRLLALKKLGIDTCPTISLDHLDDEARRAYTHVHNRLTMNSGFDKKLLEEEMEKLRGFDWESLGFGGNDWFKTRERFDRSKTGDDEYDVFISKFEHNKTTDDCYTPSDVYDAVADWVSQSTTLTSLGS